MVSLAGAKAAQPIAAEIDKLQIAINALNTAANDATASIWKIEIQVYLKGVSTTITIVDDLNVADSQATLFNIRNILGNKQTIQNNSLGAIT